MMMCPCGSEDTVVISMSQAHSIVYLRVRCRDCKLDFERIQTNEHGGGGKAQKATLPQPVQYYAPPKVAPRREDPPPARKALPRATPIRPAFNVRVTRWTNKRAAG